MKNDFQQQVETQETLDKLCRKLLDLERLLGNKNLDLMITLRADFQIKIETYCTVEMYQPDHARTLFGHPWFSDMSQEEPFKIWQNVTG